MKEKTEQTRIETKSLDAARKHCKENGLVLYMFLSRAIEEKIKKDKEDLVS